MATYTETGIGVAGASYFTKAGSATSERVGSGTDASLFIDTGSATAVFTAAGPDEATRGETGAGVSALVGSGAIAATRTWVKAGSGIAGNRFVYTRQGAAVLSGVGSGSDVVTATRIFTKAGSGITQFTGSGPKITSAGKTGGNMQPPYGSFVFGDEDYGEDTYGGFRNDARRIGSGTYVVTSPPTIFTGGGTSVRTASGLDATIYAETGTAASERVVSGSDETISDKTGGTMVPPYGSVAYSEDAYGDGWYGGFRNDGQRIASGDADKEINRAGSGIMGLSANGYFIPPTIPGDVEISEEDDILLVIADLASGDVELTVTRS